MKNKAKLFGIIAMVAVIGLSVSACQMGDDGSNNGNNGGDTKGGGNDVNDGFLGATLDLNGWVYMIEWTADYDVIFTQFPVGENRTFSSNFGVNGAIADGQLSFTIGRPAEAHMWSIAYLFGMWMDAEDFATFSDPSASSPIVHSILSPGAIFCVILTFFSLIPWEPSVINLANLRMMPSFSLFSFLTIT